MKKVIKELDYSTKRQIGKTLVQIDKYFYEVSTVSLIGEDNELARALDSVFKQDNKEFETMIFLSNKDGKRVDSMNMFLKRYDTKEEARKQHKIILEELLKGKIILDKERFSKGLEKEGLKAW